LVVKSGGLIAVWANKGTGCFLIESLSARLEALPYTETPFQTFNRCVSFKPLSELRFQSFQCSVVPVV
jgi:hypothetical protein